MKLYRSLSLIGACLIAVVAAAVAALLAILLLHAVEHLFTGIQGWSLPLGMTAVGLLAGLSWLYLRRSKFPSLTQVLQNKADSYPPLATILDAAIQIVIVGAGASIGRETAPRQAAAVLVHSCIPRFKLTPAEGKVFTACAAGAALGAVYNTPWAGAAYSLVILLGDLSLFTLAIALITAWGAVLLARLSQGSHPYYSFSSPDISWQILLWALVTVPLAALVGASFRFLCYRVRANLPSRRLLPITIGLILGATGVLSIYLPELGGNGVKILQGGFSGTISLLPFTLLILLKPLFTLLTLRAGATGGVLTPALALGAAIGGSLALASNLEDLAPAFMALTAAAVLAVSEGSWLFGTFFVIELIGASFPLAFVIVLTGIAARYAEKGFNKLFPSPYIQDSK